MSTASKLCRKQIKALTPYASARRIGGNGNIWINANETPDDESFTITLNDLNRYPECQPPQLLSAYSAYCNLPHKNILISRGADEGIELLIRTFCQPGRDSIAFCPPTYGMYAISAETCGVNCSLYPLSQEFTTPFKELHRLDIHTRLLFLCHPNNPTGTLTDLESLEQLLRQAKNNYFIVVDQAYIEFCPSYDISELVTRYDNLIVLRTLSKAFAMASLRCGFILAHEDTIEQLIKVIAPYPIPGPVATIAIQATSTAGIEKMHNRVCQINQIKQDFINEVSTLPNIKRIIQSAANFVTIHFQDAETVWKHLEVMGIIARNVSHYLHLEHCIRFSIGSEKEMALVASTLKQAASKRYSQQKIEEAE